MALCDLLETGGNTRPCIPFLVGIHGSKIVHHIDIISGWMKPRLFQFIQDAGINNILRFD